VDSKGDTTVVITKYAFEYLNTGASSGVNYEIRLLHDANMQAAPIETVTLFKRKDSASFVVQKAELYEYAGYVPSKIYTINGAFPYSGFTWSYNNSGGFYKDNRYQLETEVLSFDSEKRPKSVASRNGIVTSYVWDTLCQIPSAVVRNAAVSDIAYAGFETPGNASWSFASAARDSSSALTGRKSYILTNGNISKSGLSASLTYQVTYWHKNSSGSVSINGQTATSLGTANGWTLYSKELSSITSVTVSGTGRIDELRLHPKGAQMTSFASEALLGLTSECDQNNSLRYYEYDGLGRLTIVRDKDRNVLKKVCYNYQGQVQNCSGVYENEAKTQLFVRNNCSSGYVGTGVYYTVPAGKYTAASQAAANQLALDEISASGQSYANTNGNCVSVGCNFSVNSGFSSPTSSFSNSGTSVSFYFVFYSTSTMSSGIEYNVGTIGVSCRPSIARQMYFTSGGRSWTVTVYPDGRMTVLIASGTSVSPYSSVATPTLTYSL
jgi:YD repeat-containing protein